MILNMLGTCSTIEQCPSTIVDSFDWALTWGPLVGEINGKQKFRNRIHQEMITKDQRVQMWPELELRQSEMQGVKLDNTEEV